MSENHRDDDKTRTQFALSCGTMVGHYRIVERIGAGGMGEVYLAEDTELDRKVALKFLPPHLCRDEECRARFRREAQAAAKLNHPNIMTVYDVGEHKGRPFFSMEYVDGRSLKDSISDSPMSVDFALDIAVQVCEGLAKAHQEGIIHRDIKPSNIIIDSDNRARIVDFGLALVQSGEPVTRSGTTLGTVGYMSPEQVSGRDVDQRADLFSFGVILYELLTGVSPFRRETEAATLNAILNDAPDPLSRHESEIPGNIQEIVDRLLEKNPRLRCQNATEVSRDLKRVASASGRMAPPGPSLPSIAVLPFANLSADPEQEYFCDGMAEEIINALAHVENLRVVARTSCFAFKGRQEDIRTIGRKLDVTTLLEGSVRKAGNRLRITAQLINVFDGYHLWSERYDRELSDIFEVQDEIAIAIVDNLKVKLLGDEHEQIVKRPTENLKAYSLYLKGRYHWNKRESKNVQRAVEFLKKAVELDPRFALGYAGLADAYIIQSNDAENHEKRLALLASAEEAVARALELNESLGEAHTALAQIRFIQWRWREVEREHITAIKLNPRYATAHHWYSLFLVGRGEFRQAWEQISLARELDPLSPSIIGAQALCSYFWRKYDMTLELCREGMDIAPEFPIYRMVIGWSLLEKGDYGEAINQFHQSSRLAEMWLEDEGDRASWMVSIGLAYVKLGEHAKAKDILESVVKMAKERHASLFPIAGMYFALGDAEKGFEWLEWSVENRDFWLPLFRFSPIFDSFRDDPRFLSLMNKVGLDWEVQGSSHD